MKKILLACLFVFTLLSVTALAEEMTGLVTCAKCKHTDAAKASECAVSCVRSGVDAMFYDSASKKLYKVTNQETVKEHVGHKVMVTGKVDGENLTVENVKMAPSGGKKG